MGDGVFYPISSRIGSELEYLRLLMDKVSFQMHVAAPGIVKRFYPEDQSVDVQLVIREKILIKQDYESIKVPLLGKLPIVFPAGGDYCMTFPIQEGDECLVVFADTCIDSWWQNGGEENEQIMVRRHDLSDGFAIVGVRSNKRALANYNESAVEIRNEDASVKIQLDDDGVIIKSDSIKLGDESGLRKLIDERIVDLYNQHTHPYTNVSSPATTGTPSTPIVLSTVSTDKTEAL